MVSHQTYTGINDDSLAERAGEFCQWFRWDAYPKHRGAPYTPTRAVEGNDLDAAMRLGMAYTDEQMRELAEFFLQIPSEREKFLRGTRTVSMLLHMAPAITERLRDA